MNTPTFHIAGHSWTFLDDPPPAMHLATEDREHVIWLEDAGDRLWNPETTLPRWDLVGLKLWVQYHRRLVERAWVTQVMIPNNWVDAYLVEDDDIIVVEAYAGTLNWFGVVTVDDDIYVPVSSTDEIALNGETGDLIIGGPEGEQQRVDLAELFWRPLRR